MKKYFLISAVLFSALIQGFGCLSGTMAKLKVDQQPGSYLVFIDEIDGKRLDQNQGEYFLKPGIHKLVYSYSNTSGIFAPPRTKFYVIDVNLEYPVFYLFTSALKGIKPVFRIQSSSSFSSSQSSIIKEWSRDDCVPYEFEN